MAGKVKFSLKALKELVNSSGSCVYCKEACTKSLALLPMHLKDFKRSVKDLLASEVTTYDAELGGIILAHKFVKMMDTVPLNDDGVLHVNYTADVYFFKPEIGSTLNGTVYKKSKDFVGVLVHSIFNVAVPKPRRETDESTWAGYHVSVGSKVVCRVDYLNFTGRLPYIRATLEQVEETVGPKKKKKLKKKDSTDENSLGFKKILIRAPKSPGEVSDQAQAENNEYVVNSSPKKKKRKKDREKTPQVETPRNLNIKLPASPSPSTFSFSTPKMPSTLKMKRDFSPRTSSSDETSGSSRKKKKIKHEGSVVDDLKNSLVQEALLNLKKEESSSDSSASTRNKRKKSSVSVSPARSKLSFVRPKNDPAGDVQSLLYRAMETIGFKSSEDERCSENESIKKKKKKKSKELLE